VLAATMGCRGKGVAAVASSTLECSEASQQLVDSRNTGVDHVLKSGNMSIWSEPFNLGNASLSVCAELTRRAPFLLGSDRAQYTEDFFTETGGLYGEGIPFKKLKEDHGVLLESLLPIYPSNQSRNRHSVRHMSHSAAAEALWMYQRIYGGIQLDHGEFGTAFV
jgi:hypothetical protein